jgi:AcrR family transcriptional regulator
LGADPCYSYGTSMKIKVARKPANTYQHGNLREALVQAGLKVLSEGGVEGLSLRAAAQLAGVSHAAPYRHFKDKDALVAAIAEQGFRLLTASMRAELGLLDPTQAADTHARLVAVGKGYVHFALAHPAYLRVIFGGVLAKDRTTPDLKGAGNEAYETLRGLVANGVARGELVGGDADTLSLACWSMVHGLSHLLISDAIVLPPGMAAAAVTEILLQVLHQGVRPR